MFNNVYANETVLITGHTGFKGSWLSIWLRELGAKVVGYSLDPPTEPSNFGVCGLADRMGDVRGDVRDLAGVMRVVEESRPGFIFHLAAQPIVLTGYQDPITTFNTNVAGTINLLEAARHTDSVKAVVCITTDKVYENNEWLWGYRETDRLGGHDPYSASKAMAELAITSYRRSFFSESYPAVASARAGNVIGGGDFANYRLVPDCMKALMEGNPIQLRNPQHVRPWQHVLESLSGYLWLGAQLVEHQQTHAQAWNFGPKEPFGVTTQAIVEQAIALWGAGEWQDMSRGDAPKETKLLRLSWEKAAHQLGWYPVYTWEQTLATIVHWFQAYQRGATMYDVCAEQIQKYVQNAQLADLSWTRSG